MNKELIKKEADEFANKEYEISDIDRDALHKGFYHGAEWRINSVWHNADKKPKDGKYLTIIKVKGELIIEIAPWRNGKYQGTHHIGVLFWSCYDCQICQYLRFTTIRTNRIRKH